MKSDNVKVGMQQAPHRSLFNALGMTKEEMERPLVGIVCSYNEIVPELPWLVVHLSCSLQSQYVMVSLWDISV